MSDAVNEPWKIAIADATDEYSDYTVLPKSYEGRPSGAYDHWIMDERSYYPSTPEVGIAKHIVDVHNFVVEQGGLDTLKHTLHILGTSIGDLHGILGDFEPDLPVAERVRRLLELKR